MDELCAASNNLLAGVFASELTECTKNSTSWRLTAQQRQQVLDCRLDALASCARTEFATGVLSSLTRAFENSAFIGSDCCETLCALVEAFYSLRNEVSVEAMSDDELIAAMAREFDGQCGGSVEYLASTVMPRILHGEREEEDANDEG